jgi:hypothetical protein
MSGIGGNRYGWFDSNEFSFLAFDNTTLSTPNTVVVSPANMNGWVFFDDLPGTGTGTGGFEEGPATPPLGSVRCLQVDSTGRHALGTAPHGNAYGCSHGTQTVVIKQRKPGRSERAPV